MTYYFLDTSVFLAGKANLFDNIYISPLVLMELESIKSNPNKNEHIKYLAREAVREIISNDNIYVTNFSQRKIGQLLKKHDFLMDIPDHKILCEALLLAQTTQVKFVTGDAALYLFAQRFPELESIYLEEEPIQKKETYNGWIKCYPTEEEMASLYTNSEINVLGAQTNEFCEVFENGELKDVLFWDGKKYTNLKYANFKNQFGDKVQPRNLEQKMLFHLLQNDNIKVKVCLGGFGDGKTYCMLQHALKGIKEGRFSKIIFVRNNIITKGSKEIGFLSGDMIEKIRPYLMPIADLTSEDYLDELIQTGTLEPVPLGFMRGRDFSGDVLVFVDEAENLLKENVQLLLGRIGEGSQIWFAGDLKQIDHKDFERNNGINKMIERLAGNELFGMVRLIKSERSVTSQLADLMD